ncbi:Trk system potassium transporter TrkA [Notoacmeibacter ruber]|uniref:Trk system potassium uptake protein TrkA n=1 Tax=Notoacmeibacter ruber TaxID=2670375 RepID=A0A3L7JE67_9HYPH|nr:Trk system potassium transporter TrkA [Notoacmeibacter ruber]RLQ87871.1 Trk system potassium transporter TrkA [Notoacmeibacter ruber]
MRIIICGAGRVGYGIAERLSAEEHDVTVIDTAMDLVRQVRDTLDARGVVGHGSHPDILEQAGAADADMMIAVTLHDEVNMVACQVAHSLFDVPTKIARVRSQSYRQGAYQDLFSRDHMPIDVIISPEQEVGEMVLRRIAIPGATDVVRFANDKVVMVAIECAEECPVVNTPLSQLSDLFPDLRSTVVGIQRGERLFIPHSSDQMYAGDTAYVVADTTQVKRTLALFGHEEPAARRIVIGGGGNIGLYVAKAIETRGTGARVKIMESDRDRAAMIADQLKRTVVLHGSALDQNLLVEADVADADLFVALTNDDQVNILSGVMAKRVGCGSNLVLMNNPSYHEFSRLLGIDAFVNPRSVTISRVLQHVRRGRIRAVHSVQKGAAEIIEAEALETSPLVGTPLREANLPVGARIGAIFRDNQVIRPTGNTKIKPSDRVVILSMQESVREVEQVFRVSLEFF